MMAQKRTVELKPAYHWLCDDCGETNFIAASYFEMTTERKEEMLRGQLGLNSWDPLPDAWQNMGLIRVPTKVVCKKCSAEFSAIDEGDNE
jgi:hypothetical protein